MWILDIFRINKIKSENEKLRIEIDEVKNDLSLIKLTKEESEYLNLKKEIEFKTNELCELKNKEEETLKRMKSDENALLEKIKSLNEELIQLDEELLLQSFGLYTPRYNLVESKSYKNKLDEIRRKQKDMIKNKTALNYYDGWTLDGSIQKGRAMNNDNMKMVLRAFNNECEASIQKVKFNNITSIENKIIKSAEAINKINVRNKIEITKAYLNLKLEELYLAYEYECKKEEEREEQRQIKERLREEAKRLAEIEKLKEKVRKEKEHLENALAKYKEQLVSAPDELSVEIENKIAELEDAIQNAIKKEEDIENEEANNRAGYVYVISNIGAFGENVYKIGMTRRLEPFDRIKELSSASVPFSFDVHAMIFSEDAPGLENTLHKEFANNRVNLVNKRKEFFNVTLEEIERVVKSNHNSTIEFTKIAIAEEYRQSELMRNDKKEV